MAPTPPGERSREGELLAGKYRLEALLGSGGMGDVYRATHRLIGRTVAIKLLRSEHASNEEITRRFLREARAANIVRHPNVVDVLDIGQDDLGAPFIVQEFLVGEDLGKRLEDFGGRLAVEAVLTLLLPICEAIAFAHAKGVVHRDLKPGNIFLAREGKNIVPKLLDFGISQIARGDGDRRLTISGVAMGTPSYMSPEQVQGLRLVDARSDVWSLGVILYEVVSGAMPFEGETHSALFVKIATADPPPLQSVATGIPESLSLIVDRCLRRNRDERYATGAELLADLVCLKESRPISARPVAARPPEPTEVVVRGSQRPHGAPSNRAAAPTLPLDPVMQSTPPVPSISRIKPAEEAHEAGQHLRFDGEDEGTDASGLSLAVQSPPSPATTHRHRSPPRSPPIDAQGKLAGLAALGTAVIATMALLGFLNPLPEGWPIFARLAPFYDLLPLAARSFVVVALLASGVLAMTRALQSSPRVWGFILASAGILFFASILGLPFLTGDQAHPSGVPAVVPLAAAMVPLGIGVAGLERIWHAWANDWPGKGRGVLFAALGLFVALQVGRAADAPPAQDAPSGRAR